MIYNIANFLNYTSALHSFINLIIRILDVTITSVIRRGTVGFFFPADIRLNIFGGDFG